MFAIMGGLIKLVSVDTPTELIVFFRNFFGFLLILPFILKRGLRHLATEIPRWHLARALFGLAAMYSFFYSINHIPLAESVLLSYTTPLFAPFLAYLILKEAISVRLIFAVILGFVGVVFLLNPDFRAFSWASLVALSSGLFASAAMTSIRKMSTSEPAIRIVFYYGFICTAVSAVPVLLIEQWPGVNILMTLLAVGAFATLGQYCLTKAYSMANVAQVGPFVYSTVVFASIIAWLFWQEIPSLFTGFGIFLVIIAGTLALRQTPVAGNGQ